MSEIRSVKYGNNEKSFTLDFHGPEFRYGVEIRLNEDQVHKLITLLNNSLKVAESRQGEQTEIIK